MKLNPNNPNEFTMTVEGRPEIDYDWKAEYARQRKDRLTDAVHEYLDEQDISIDDFYHDLQDILVDMLEYHKTLGEKAANALLLIHGKSEEKKEESPRSYEYSADISLSDIRRFQQGH